MLLLQGWTNSAATIHRQFERGGYKAVVLGQVDYYKKLSEKQYVPPLQLVPCITHNSATARRPWLFSRRAISSMTRSCSGSQNDPAYDFLHGDERYRSSRPTDRIASTAY